MIALVATLAGLASCGSNPGASVNPDVSYQDPGIVIPGGTK